MGLLTHSASIGGTGLLVMCMLEGRQGDFDYTVRPHKLRNGEKAWLWEVRLRGRLVDAGAALQSAEQARDLALGTISYAKGAKQQSA